MQFSIKKIGPGFLFAGAAIGVSHLVQSTRAGADFAFGLLWALLLINAIKYPFFEFGTRYASATGESLLQGYEKMGRPVLIAYFLITFATMFTIQTAVTIVTAGIATTLFGVGSIVFWTAVITGVCFIILLLGRYKALDTLMKIIVLCLTASTILAVVLAIPESNLSNMTQVVPNDTASLAFLIAFMGWMPAPMDISIWQSMWTLEKKNLQPDLSPKQSRFDFNVGYVTTTILAIGFLSLGALVMFGNGQSFSNQGGAFANELINMYAFSLGDSARLIIGVAALTTMFSTTLTTLDGSPRVMQQTFELLSGRRYKRGYLFWLLILILGTLSVFFFLLSEMALLIDIATILSFITAPFYAIFNYKLLTGRHTPKLARPSRGLQVYALIGIAILIGFSIWYIVSLF